MRKTERCQASTPDRESGSQKSGRVDEQIIRDRISPFPHKKIPPIGRYFSFFFYARVNGATPSISFLTPARLKATVASVPDTETINPDPN